MDIRISRVSLPIVSVWVLVCIQTAYILVGHRLDRTTSGVLVLPRNSASDQEVILSCSANTIRLAASSVLQFKRLLLAEGSITKEYVCKVEGIFPE